MSLMNNLTVALSPPSILRTLWKRRLMIAVLFVAGTSGTVAVVHRMRPVYKAEAVVLVESQKIPETFVAATVQVMLEARLDMLKKQVLSQDRLWDLITEFDLYPELRVRLTRQEVIAEMRDDVTITMERGWSTSRPGAFRISYSTFNPRVAAEVANRIANFFIGENLRQRKAEAEGTSIFLEGQLEEAKRNLQAQEARLSEYKRAYNGELPQQEAALVASIGQSRVELLGTQDALARAQQNKLALENSLKIAEAGMADRRELARLRILAARPAERPAAAPQPTALDLARQQLQTLRLRYHDQHPDVQRLMREVERLEKIQPPGTGRRQPTERAQAAAGPSSAEPDGNRQSVDEERIYDIQSQLALLMQEIKTLEARRQRILEEIAATQAHLRNVPLREQQLAVITRDYETSRVGYASMLSKKMAADVATDMERKQKAEKFVLLDTARIPEKPSRPKKPLLIGMGAFCSLASAAALAVALGLRKNAVLGEWELPPGVTVIGQIPRLRIGSV